MIDVTFGAMSSFPFMNVRDNRRVILNSSHRTVERSPTILTVFAYFLAQPSVSKLTAQYNQIWAKSGPDRLQMGQIRGFFSDQIQYILARRAKMY